MKRKRIISLLTGLIIISILITACSKVPDGVVAKVNGHYITEEVFNKDFEAYKHLFVLQNGEGTLDQVYEGKTYEDLIKEQILEKLIQEQLIFEDMAKLNLVVTDEEVQIEIDKFIETVEGEDKYEEFLESNGFSREFFEINLKKELMMDKHQLDYNDKNEVTEEEIQEFYDDHKESLVTIRASHILLDDEDEAEAILKRLDEGEDFAKLAEEESTDTVSALEGGDLGYFTRDKMIDEFSDAAFTLRVGETSGIVSSSFGYHIIRLVDRKETYDDLRDDIIPVIQNNNYVNLLVEMKEKAKIERYI